MGEGRRDNGCLKLINFQFDMLFFLVSFAVFFCFVFVFVFFSSVTLTY